MAFQRKKPAALGTKAPYPGLVEPAPATEIERVPTGARWIHEIKFDGYRVQVHLANETIKVFTRRGNDWTRRFRKIADDAWHISAVAHAPPPSLAKSICTSFRWAQAKNLIQLRRARGLPRFSKQLLPLGTGR
ncbi:hypothetical protein CWO90_19925 [Bradyrhizobium sp. Leo121]|nr:hypothetical protein CWO90_19925 [Bradyrhizobium sp. Leo121]